MKSIQRLAAVLAMSLYPLVGIAAAQTQVNPLTQLQSPTPGVASGTLFMVLTTGKIAVVNLGTCFSITGSGTTASPYSLAFNPATTGCAPTTATVPSFSDAEVPGGTVTGTNATFTLAHADANTGNSLILTKNGVVLKGGGVDYTLAVSGTTGTITFVTAAIPQTSATFTDALLAWYRY
jgi:hypothetical protein